MTRSEMISNCNKLAGCLETQAVSSWKCTEVGNCNNCPYNLPSTAEAAVSVRAMLSEVEYITNNMVRFTIK